jgi:transposase
MRLPRQTLCDWSLAAAESLSPIANRQMQLVCGPGVLQLDDTPVMCQGGAGEPNFQACLWTFVNPEVAGVAFRFTPGRASALPAAEIGDFAGVLVGDGYSGNAAAADKASGQITVAGCWAHVNRKFRDAETEAPGTAKLFRDDIRKLYAIEHEADEAKLRAQPELPCVGRGPCRCCSTSSAKPGGCTRSSSSQGPWPKPSATSAISTGL